MSMLITTEPCLGHGEVASFKVNPGDYLDWTLGRKHIQDAFPYLDDGEREWLVSRLCPKCWEETLPPEDEDESPLDPESDYPEYADDYYVDRDCD